MANKKNWARRNKKPNNWRAMLNLRKKNEIVSFSQSEAANNHYDLDQNYNQEISSDIIENRCENDIYETPTKSFKRRRTHEEYESIQLPENYYEILREFNDEISDDQETPSIDPLLSDVANNEDQDEDDECFTDDDNGDFSDGSDDDFVGEGENDVEDESTNNGTETEDEYQQDSDSDSTEEEKFSGRRIFDIRVLIQQINEIGRHSQHCNSDMILVGETKRGLNSIFKLVCKKCGMKKKLESCPKKPNSMSCNEDAVLGITSIGSGYYHLKEFFTNLNIPVMGNTLYDKIQKGQQSVWYDLAQKSALDALHEEIALARTIGSIDSFGNALMPVICDGGWGKRSYGKAFNSLSGCAVLVGLRKGKIVYFGVRNKYCHKCKIAESKSTTPDPHVCNKNFDGPSSGMESDIITEGFKLCEQYGARFNKLISDGDSNTFKNLRDLRIYRNPDLFIEKCECCNHLHRNFRTKFGCLCHITKFDVNLRKHVKPSKGHDISKGIKVASKHWREQANSTIGEKIAGLEEDIMNAPAHYFGVHHKCKSYFCKKTTTKAAIDNLKLLKDDGLYYEVLNFCQNYFAAHVKSLLKNYTNNPAEEFNSVVANGGKRINYSLGGSYKARVAAAVVQFNTKGHVGSEFRKHKFGNASNPRLVQMENSRRAKLIKNAAKPRAQRVFQEDSTKGAYYHGDGCEDVDMEPVIFENAKKVFVKKLKHNQRNRDLIEESTRGGKHNSHWQQIRQDLLPSTFISKIILSKNKKSYKGHLEELMYKRSEFGNSAANKHQRLVERDAVKVFEAFFEDYMLEDCGLFIDKELNFLCASPLKLYGPDHVLNIKCPHNYYNKKLDDVIKKLSFWDVTAGKLNEKHEWYIELQSELRITGRKSGFIMVWLGEHAGEPQYRIQEVPKDDSFFEKQIKPQVTYFYNECMMKELVDSRKARHMSLREYNAEKDSFL